MLRAENESVCVGLRRADEEGTENTNPRLQRDIRIVYFGPGAGGLRELMGAMSMTIGHPLAM